MAFLWNLGSPPESSQQQTETYVIRLTQAELPVWNRELKTDSGRNLEAARARAFGSLQCGDGAEAA